jgi:hypothetical protein
MFKQSLLTLILSASHLLSAVESQWELTETIWNFGLASQCDQFAYWNFANPYQYFREESFFDGNLPSKIQSGDIVWLKCIHFKHFYYLVLPQITQPFVLVILDGDESFPSQGGVAVENYIHHPKIIHIFAQNCDYLGDSDKITPLPIGVDFHSIAYKGGRWKENGSPKQQEETLKKILQNLQPTHIRKVGAFVDFQLNDTTHDQYSRYLEWGEDRASIFLRILPSGVIEYSSPMPRADLWKTKGQYAFSISPYGNGLDCHRTWEDLVLGCIVIVKTSPLDPLYDGLPVVIVDDWSEITRENMEKWLIQYGDAFTNPSYREKLTNSYWLKKVRETALPYKSQSGK